MQNQTPPLILTFGAADPVGATGIQADLATFAAMGCHGLSVITSILISDTAHIADIQIIDVDSVADQARTILEDMPVAAFKIGAVGSVDHISAIAEIVSDYPDIPLVLAPFISAVAEQEDEDHCLIALRDLLIPQSTLVLTSAIDLTRLAETWRESITHDILQRDAMHMIEMGCEYLFVTGTPNDPSKIANTLFDESGVVRCDRWERLAGSFAGTHATLSAAICAMLANGLSMAEAISEAQEFTLATLVHSQRLGMGKLIPDRYFWAHISEEEQ